MESFIFFFFFLLDSSRTTSSSLFLTTTTTIIAVCNKTFLILNQLTSSFEHSNGGGSSCCCYIHRYIKIPFGNYQSGFSSLPPFFFAYKDTISSDWPTPAAVDHLSFFFIHTFTRERKEEKKRDEEVVQWGPSSSCLYATCMKGGRGTRRPIRLHKSLGWRWGAVNLFLPSFEMQLCAVKVLWSRVE